MFTKAFFKNVIIFTLIIGAGLGLLYWYNNYQVTLQENNTEQGASTLRSLFEN